ncbi:Sulfite reductase [NADPH] subunit beta [Ceratocystis platani]|uniref:Sulfite reductase [NADPH] subunit beta n=1 Tax=Ceratocystis fimbriata f. sp. platani TaxID=88771 RepID=A0A0F8DML7_CERFI|nr:Sulfite reductase [NADPH] subunit beta [Ceratocystis platani]
MSSTLAIGSPSEAVARIAYLSSDVIISVQPSLDSESEFSPWLKAHVTQQTKSLVASKTPEVIPVRFNADPLLSVFTPIRSGRLTTITTSSNILIPSIGHLYKLASYPVVIHVSLGPSENPDYSAITSIRNVGWTFLQSETVQEAQDMALTAHALAIRSGKGVIHFFPSSIFASSESPVIPETPTVVEALLDSEAILKFQATTYNHTSIYSDEKTSAAPTPSEAEVEQKSTVATSEDIFAFATDIWYRLSEATGRQYRAFEYFGSATATNCVFVFGANSHDFVETVANAESGETFANTGILTARLYRPWLGFKLVESIPKSVKKIAVLEQVRRKTTRWGPVLLDVLTSVKSGPGGVEAIVGHQLGHLTPATVSQALRGVVQNLISEKPIQNLEVGVEVALSVDSGYKIETPKVETAYTKILNQLFGQRAFVANALTSENTGISKTITATPEFGFGSLLAHREKRNRFISEAKSAASSKEFASDSPSKALAKWSLSLNGDGNRTNIAADEVIKSLESDNSDLSQKLLKNQDLFRKESLWLVGSDAWSYDLGNSGVHHVLASGQNVNMLIIDSTPYSERSAADATRRKKDIGLYAMNFGNVYVASTAVYSSYTQVLQAMMEADKFEGPSVVLAYLPYYGEHDSALTVLQETKKAVDVGYWPLYRWNPQNETQDEPNFILDSERIKKELKDFLSRDNQLTQLMKKQPQYAASLAQDFGTEVRTQQKRQAKDAYDQLLEGLFGAPLTVLYASDNGNATSVAKRLASRGRARGLKSQVMTMEDYPLEDLPGEENIVFVTSTAGQGEFPQNGHALWTALKDNMELDLASVNYSVFGLGDKHYWPRKEDRIYYNKPAKDLDRVLANLGAKRLTDVGLGDDQDPDGYQTGYQEWEPKIWAALGVDKVDGLPEEPAPITNEDIKIASNFLRGTIEEGLKDTTTGAISEWDQQLTKFHGTYMQDDRDIRDERRAQGLEPAYSFMIRCRLDGAVATPQQWIAMDDIATHLGNNTMKLTTRQTFQFHGIVKGKLKPAMQAINRAMMTSLAACGDVNRTIMCSPTLKHSIYHREIYECSQRISTRLLPATRAYHEIWLTGDDKKVQVAGEAVQDFEPLYGPTYLPRKFKITIATPPHNDTDVYAHDIGLVSIRGEDGHLAGFNLMAGGGMGTTHNNKKTYPQTGRMMGFVSRDQVDAACEKVMLVQRDHGDRKNRKHARLKYTIDDMGVDVFRSKVEELWGQKFGEPRPFKFESNVDVFGWVKDDVGLNHFTMFIENGRVEDTPEFQMKTGLRDIASKTKGEFRLTGNQHVVLSNIADEDLEETKALLKKWKLDNTQFSGLRLSSSACVAFPTCGLAMAESERYLPVLIGKLETYLEELGLRHDSIVMRMTGCPNGCARPWLAEVAFVGKAYDTYNMYLGGGYHGQRLNKMYRQSIKEDEILATLKPLLKRYALERDEGERFGDFLIRVGVIKATTDGTNFHDGIPEEDE